MSDPNPTGCSFEFLWIILLSINIIIFILYVWYVDFFICVENRNFYSEGGMSHACNTFSSYLLQRIHYLPSVSSSIISSTRSARMTRNGSSYFYKRKELRRGVDRPWNARIPQWHTLTFEASCIQWQIKTLRGPGT